MPCLFFPDMFNPLPPLAFCALLFVTVSVNGQQVIFNDDFATDPAAAGWTENIVTTNTATGDIFSTGTAAEFDKTGGAGRVDATITRFFDTSGFRNVTVEIFAFQSATQFEGGAYLANNVDSLSIFVDTGGGFTPLFQRTGVWGTTTPGFVDGGTGAGNTVSTSSGSFTLGAAAANNANLGIRIEGVLSAAAESYFLDDFFLRGNQIVAPLTTEGRVTVTDTGAVNSLLFSGLPAIAAMGDANLGAIHATRRDINERLFRLRAGIGAHPVSKMNSPLLSDANVPEEILFVKPQEEQWRWWAHSDFGRQRIDNVGGEAGSAGDTHSGSVGVEYSGAKTWAAGLAWTYLESDYNFGGNIGGLDLNGHQLHAYLSWLPTQNSYLSFLYTLSDLQNELHRNTGLGTMTQGGADGLAHSASLDGGYNLRLGEGTRPVVTGPFFGLDYTEGQIDGFSETGPTRGALDVFGQEYESLISKIGWQVSRTSEMGKVIITPQLRAAWEREHEGPDNAVTAQLQQSPFFSGPGNGVLNPTGGLASTLNQARPGRDYLSAGGGVRLDLSDAWSVSLDYEGHFFRKNANAHYGGIRVSGRF